MTRHCPRMRNQDRDRSLRLSTDSAAERASDEEVDMDQMVWASPSIFCEGRD